MNKFFKRFIILVHRKVVIIILAVAFVITVSSALFIASIVSKYNTESQITVLEYQILQRDDEITKYKEQLKNVIKIRDQYRFNVKEIVKLLYNKDTAVGGTTEFKIPTSDESVLLQMQTTISSMNDDLLLMSGVKDYLTARQGFINSFPFSWPVSGGIPRITAGYGFIENPFKPGEIRFHAGIDIPGDSSTPILATADGIVGPIYTNNYSTGEHPDYGKFLIVKHDYGFETYYGHADHFIVKWGQHVKRGDILGYIGSSGPSTGPHLHYEIRNNRVSIDPLSLLAMPY